MPASEGARVPITMPKQRGVYDYLMTADGLTKWTGSAGCTDASNCQLKLTLSDTDPVSPDDWVPPPGSESKAYGIDEIVDSSFGCG